MRVYRSELGNPDQTTKNYLYRQFAGVMAIPNQERGQFQPGQSGNPSGKAKGAKNRSTILKKWIAADCTILDPESGKEIPGTLEDKIALALIGKAIKGDVPAIREIYDSIYGKGEIGGKDLEGITVIRPKSPSEMLTIIMPSQISDDLEFEES